MTVDKFLGDNFVMIYELGGLVILLLVGAHISAKMKRRTFIAVLMLFVELFCYVAERWTQTFPSYSILRPLLTATLYSIYPAIIIVMMLIISTNMSRKRFVLILIPEMVCVPLFYTSQWTHIVFYYHLSNNYAGGLVPKLPYVLFIFYVIVFLVHNLIYLRFSSRIDRTIAFYISICPLAGAIGFMLLGIDKDYSTLFTSGMLLYFTYLYIHMAKKDPLTNLYNRQSYYQDIDMNSKYITGVVSIDMNDLKYLNDNFGHQAGDDALKTVAKIIRSNCGNNATVYRVGGDEFMIFYIRTSEIVICNDIKAMRDAMGKTEYVCAFGYEMTARAKSIQDAIRVSDQLMYDNKAEIKKVRNLNATTSRL
ncbi:MAG: GGDEF domain-containing protein [Clostridiales bacterium]|nr:GGDEF domain-containing protein [Clostridiales bacterium]